MGPALGSVHPQVPATTLLPLGLLPGLGLEPVAGTWASRRSSCTRGAPPRGREAGGEPWAAWPAGPSAEAQTEK